MFSSQPGVGSEFEAAWPAGNPTGSSADTQRKAESFARHQADVGKFSHDEIAFYQELMASVDPGGSGLVYGTQGAELLRRSRLPEGILRSIWQEADTAGEGCLNAERFYVAMRLIAHAQAGRRVSSELADSEPPNLPTIDGFERTSSQQPLGAEHRSAKRSSRSHGSLRSPRWAPSGREARKYATLFLKTDRNADGFVEPYEAKELCDRSNLDADALKVAWRHADQDMDGKLNFPEFVCLVHLVSSCVKGQEMPSLEKGLPSDLAQAMRALATQSPQELDASRSPSASRSSSAVSSRSPSPGPSHAALGATPASSSRPCAGDKWASENLSLPMSSFSQPLRRKAYDDSSPRDLSENKVQREDKRRRERRARRPDDLQLPDFGGTHHAEGEASSPSSGLASPRFGSGPSSTVGDRPPRTDAQDIEEMKRQFQAVMQSDRIVSQHLRRETDSLQSVLLRVREECHELLPQTERRKEEASRFADVLTELDRRLVAAKQQLSGLHSERRAQGLEKRSQRRERRWFEEEHAFLKQTLEEEARLLEEARQSNDQLEKSHKALQEDLAGLEAQRRGLFEDGLRERDAVQREEQQTAELRSSLRARSRDVIATKAAPVHVVAGTSDVGSVDWPSRHSEPYSWASSLVVNNAARDSRSRVGF